MPGAPNRDYFYPGTECLVNRFDERDPERLDRMQALATTIAWPSARVRLERKRTAETIHHKGGGTPDWGLKHLMLVHTELFKRVYPFAGKKRTVNIYKAPTHFTPHDRIEDEAKTAFRMLNRDLQALGKNTAAGPRRDGFVDVMTDFYARINGVHVFREGNGRTMLMVCSAIAREQGYELEWAKVRSPGTKYLFDLASATAYAGDKKDLRKFFNQIVTVRSGEEPQETPMPRRYKARHAIKSRLLCLDKG